MKSCNTLHLQPHLEIFIFFWIFILILIEADFSSASTTLRAYIRCYEVDFGSIMLQNMPTSALAYSTFVKVLYLHATMSANREKEGTELKTRHQIFLK